MMLIDNEFNIGDFVYLKTDMEQERGIVTSIVVKQNGGIDYQVSFGTVTYQACSVELSAEKSYAYD